MLVGIAATPPSNWLCLVAYGVGMVSVMTWRRVPWGKILKRVAIEFSFLSLVLVSSLWQSSGAILWQWGALQISVGGLTVMMGIFAKALLSLLLVNALQQRLTLPQFLSALRYLRVPTLLVATMGFMLRYISILQSEFHQMRSAAIARNGFVSSASTRRTIAQIISGGFIRTLGRGEIVHNAMMARGYTGNSPQSLHPSLQKIDYGAVIATALITLLPQALLR